MINRAGDVHVYTLLENNIIEYCFGQDSLNVWSIYTVYLLRKYLYSHNIFGNYVYLKVILTWNIIKLSQ